MLVLPGFYLMGNLATKENRICLNRSGQNMENDPNCDTNEPPLALGGSLRAKGVHHK